MRTGRRQFAASPVLIGAVTLLVAIVAVFISYSANTGLPFVPTYQLRAELPNGAKLVAGNEVRAGGFRVGIVKEITSVRRRVDGEVRSIAQLDLELDKAIERTSPFTRLRTLVISWTIPTRKPPARTSLPGTSLAPFGSSALSW